MIEGGRSKRGEEHMRTEVVVVVEEVAVMEVGGGKKTWKRRWRKRFEEGKRRWYLR